jgi:hypothetical protein
MSNKAQSHAERHFLVYLDPPTAFQKQLKFIIQNGL